MVVSFEWHGLIEIYLVFTGTNYYIQYIPKLGLLGVLKLT